MQIKALQNIDFYSGFDGVRATSRFKDCAIFSVAQRMVTRLYEPAPCVALVRVVVRVAFNRQNCYKPPELRATTHPFCLRSLHMRRSIEVLREEPLGKATMNHRVCRPCRQSHQSIGWLLVLVTLTSGCTMSSNKLFSWMSPAKSKSQDALAQASDAAAHVDPANAAGPNLERESDHSIPPAAQPHPHGCIADPSAPSSNRNRIATFEWADELASRRDTARPKPPERPCNSPRAQKPLTPIQRELNNFKSFPFDFEMVDVYGKPIRLQDLRGKVVVVDIWEHGVVHAAKSFRIWYNCKTNMVQTSKFVGLCNERTQDTRAATQRLTAAMQDLESTILAS